MIRRLMGSDWLLIDQDEHARLAGAFAEHVGNQLFDAPADADRFAEAVAMHDRGWVELDRLPMRTSAGEPGDIFETPVARGLTAWSGSAEHAVAANPLAGLLVSLHSLSLSISLGDAPDAAADLSDPTTRFALNKFQHRQVELQEQCRKSMGLSHDLPLRHGLAEDSADPREQSVVHQFRLLQAVDKISLALCCTKPPNTQIKPVQARPGGRSITLRLRRITADTVKVTPWPFDTGRISVDVPVIRLRVQRFNSDQAMHDAIAAAPRERVRMSAVASR